MNTARLSKFTLVKVAASIVASFFVLIPAIAAEQVVYTIAPDDTDSSIHRALDPNKVVFGRSSSPGATLFVFLPGTGAHPANYTRFLGMAADAGYRAIGLEYNTLPAVAVLCPKNPEPSCSESFREKRAYGKDVTSIIDDLPAELIINRLTKLLAFLDAKHPGEGWSNYLTNGSPDWNRIAVGGHSQGAGMAALIAKRSPVARVALLSSPFDNYSSSQQLAPWISSPSATPPDLWYGAYHQQEPMAAVLKIAYDALRIESSHVRVLNLHPLKSCEANCEHSSTAHDRATPLTDDGAPAYAKDWSLLLGKPQ